MPQVEIIGTPPPVPEDLKFDGAKPTTVSMPASNKSTTPEMLTDNTKVDNSSKSDFFFPDHI